MKVLILGSGVIGVTSAYYLAKKGVRLRVCDRHTLHQAKADGLGAGMKYSGWVLRRKACWRNRDLSPPC